MWCISGDCLGNGGPYFYTDWRAGTPWGNTRPDYGRQQVRDYIKDMAQMWLNEYHADGLRWDGTKWVFSSDWLQADEQIIKPMAKAAADKYATEKKLTRRTPADCQS